MLLVTTGTTPHLEQMWNSAVLVPKTYLATSEGLRTVTRSEPPGHDVHTPPCLTQKEQVQARAGISTGAGCHARTKEMFAQWQLPVINIARSWGFLWAEHAT
jgi:hypothetical protein